MSANKIAGISPSNIRRDEYHETFDAAVGGYRENDNCTNCFLSTDKSGGRKP